MSPVAVDIRTIPPTIAENASTPTITSRGGSTEENVGRREAIEARNQADSVVYQTEKTLKEHGDKLDASDKQLVEDALKEAKEALAHLSARATHRST